jgi:1-deoxy-D-xylulose-5-phosphate synthase
MQNLHVVLCVDRAGIVGNDGETHHGLLDLSYLSSIPNMTILAPSDFKELELMLEFAINYDGPIAIRYPRGGETKEEYNHPDIKLGTSNLISKGKDLTIITIGNTLTKGIELTSRLKEQNITCDLIDSRFLKPLDEKTIIKSISKTKKCITIEDNLLKGGLSTNILELINNNKLDIDIKSFGYNDTYVTHGSISELENLYKLDIDNIYKETIKYIKKR